MFDDIEPADPLKFVDKKAYKDRLKTSEKSRVKGTRWSRQGIHQGQADHDRRDGPDVHDGIDGERGWGEDHADDRGAFKLKERCRC